MNYEVARRTNEIGVRMALGAQSKSVMWLVLKESLVLLGAGIAIGIPSALAVTRLLKSQLFGLKANDPITFAGAVFTVCMVTLLAAYFPALRATKVDPMVALRYE
jgi:ABC-type antimicrobial peptide transport system permease subunit